MGGGGGGSTGRVLVREAAARALVHFSLPPLRSLLAATTVYVNNVTRKLCAAMDEGAVLAEGDEAEAALSARQAATGAYSGQSGR